MTRVLLCLLVFLFWGPIFCVQDSSTPFCIREPIKNYLNKDLRICSFGASVTAQKDSIWDHFVKELNAKTHRNHQHIKMGYGGEHLYPTSVCCIDDVVRNRPDVCILDWFDTGYVKIDAIAKKCLETLILKLREIGVYIIFFYHVHDDYVRKINLGFIEFIESMARQYNVTSYFEPEVLLKMPASQDLLRDTVHTTAYGSAYLGKIFADHFMQIPIKNDWKIADFTFYPLKNCFYNVRKMTLDESMIHGEFSQDGEGYFVFDQQTVLAIPLKGHFLGMSMKKGPFSPIVKIIIDNQKEYKASIWDPWCHYERKTIGCLDFAGFDTYKSSKNITFLISSELPDYSKSKKSFNYAVVKKVLKVKDLFVVLDENLM